MKSQSMLLAALASTPAALAHTIFTDFLVNGMPQGDGVAIRMSRQASTAGSPINGLNSDDMACNVDGTKGVDRVASVPDGATLSFEIREWANDPSKGRIDRGHYGPCAVYLKKVSSAISDPAKGDGWFKIFDRGYDASSKTWCTDKIIDNNGLLNVVLPEGLEGGAYLARPEILALHNANKGDPQFYTGCAQIHLDSTGNLGPESTVSIPGHVQLDTPSTNFNIYTSDLSKYEVPGPPVAKLVAKSDSASISSSQTEGLKPAGCLVENANWCGVEVPSYSSESGCWSSAEDCWNQGETCWSSAPPTGGKGCELWQTKCEGIQAACKAGNFNGPPEDFGRTPEKSQVDVGEIMPVNGGGVIEGPAKPKPTTSKAEEAAKPTPAPAAPEEEEKPQEEEEGEKQDEVPAAPAPAPAKPTSDAAAPAPAKPNPQAPKPTPSDSYSALPVPDKNEGAEENDGEEQEVKPTTTAPPSAPKPTKGPGCLPGYKCVTVTEIATLTQTVYVTEAAEGYKRGVEAFKKRRHAHMHRF